MTTTPAIQFSARMIADTPAFWTGQEDIAVIEEEVRRLDDLIHHLHEDRARLLRKLNSIQAATRCFPPEILSTIFRFVRPPIDCETHFMVSGFPEHDNRRNKHEQDDFQLVLGAVSHRWRKIAWATPELWTTISVKVHQETCHNNASLLNLYFDNSRGFPMSVELDFRAQLLSLQSVIPEQLEAYISLIDPVKTSVLNNAVKIEKLLITGLPVQWMSLVFKGFTLCKSVALHWPSSYTRRYRDVLDLTGLPSLHRLYLRGLCTPFILQWPMITKLQVLNTPIQACIELLVKCPNLINFESESASLHTPHNAFPPLSQPVVLEHLESLTWSVRNDPWTFAFLRHIRFTKLRCLRWSCPSQDTDRRFRQETNDEVLGIFFSNLPETLQVLEVFDADYTRKSVETILASIPHLLELVLSGWTEITRWVVETVGRPAVSLAGNGAVPGTTAIGPRQCEGPKALPCLRKLTLKRHSKARSEMIVEMLEALHGARSTQERFRLELVDMSLYWESEDLKRLKRLATSGFEFEIVRSTDSQMEDILVARCAGGVA